MKYEALLPGPRPLEYDLKMVSPYRIHQRCANTFRIGRVLLAGDAAHLTNPFGGYANLLVTYESNCKALLTRYSLGLTGGLLDAGALANALIDRICHNAPDNILDKYSEVRRAVFQNVVDPTAQANLRRLCESDPATVGETDPFLRSILAADIKERQKIRGLRSMRVEL